MRKTLVAAAALLFLSTYLTSCIIVPRGQARVHRGYNHPRPVYGHHYGR